MLDRGGVSQENGLGITRFRSARENCSDLGNSSKHFFAIFFHADIGAATGRAWKPVPGA